jgi:methylmalonyl-CoA mutase cobalamin-binding domain/chain
MSSLLEQLSICIERGKIDINSSYPPDLKGEKGADELTKEALNTGIKASDILENALIPGMNKIGIKFKENKVFVPDVLMAAKAMKTAMEHLKPFFQKGEVKRRGVLIIGTVSGDLHDIGKNLVALIVEGAGWEVIDLGVNVKPEAFVNAAVERPEAIIGLSSLLTTTMVSMDQSVKAIKAKSPKTRIIIGGAPVTDNFAREIGADAYASDPQNAIEALNKLI